jgi:small subunit ribosomal protein S2
VHVIDLEKTQAQLQKAVEFLANAARENRRIVFVGTKKQATGIVKKAAELAGVSYVTTRWLGGLITNFQTVQKAIKKLEKAKITLTSSEFESMKKRDKVKLQKEIEKAERLVGGLTALNDKPEVLVLIGAHDEKNAIKEARCCGVATVAIVDTNADPNLVDYPIPANDDATKSLQLLTDLLARTIKENKGLVQKQ